MDDDGPDPPDYGDSFADVYDEWYGHITDADATADRVAELAAGTASGRVLELGIGSGRVALHLVARGLTVVGIDSSEAMLAALRAKPEAQAITAHLGDMAHADEVVDGPFGVVLIAFNTLFNLDDEGRQKRCLAAVASLLEPGGSLLVEAFVPGDAPTRVERDLSTARVELDRVVLAATEHDPATQRITGQHIDITSDGLRLRPWRIRYVHPEQLDAMADVAGLDLVDRHADWGGSPLRDTDTTHISHYRRVTDRG